jgi:hypothetical protein
MRRTVSALTSQTTPSRQSGFVLGRNRFAQISAVEGIALTSEMLATLDQFDQQGLSAEQRRHAIRQRFAPPH